MTRTLVILALWFGLSMSANCQYQVDNSKLYQFQQFNGKYDFTMIGGTMIPKPNDLDADCLVGTSSSATLDIGSHSVHKAYLFWSAAGRDVSVSLNGNNVEADRIYTRSSYSNINEVYTSARTDVTDIVRQTGSAEYTVNDFDVSRTKSTYCNPLVPGPFGPTGGSTLYAGWSLLVIYDVDANSAQNSITVYDGMDLVNNQYNFQFDLEVEDPSGARIAFLCFEGDKGMGTYEYVRFNGNELLNDVNPYSAVFNSSNSFTNDHKFWNMDLDYFDIDQFIEPNTDSGLLEFYTKDDLVYMTLVVTSVKSTLPNPSLEILSAMPDICGERKIDLSFRVGNTNASAQMPSGIPISFYAQHPNSLFELVGQEFTDTQLAINDFLDMDVTIDIPEEFGSRLDIIARINDDGTGNRPIKELSVYDNEDELLVEALGSPLLYFPNAIAVNGNGSNEGFGPVNDESCLQLVDQYSIQIFDRYGMVVYDSEDIEQRYMARSEKGRHSQGYYIYRCIYGGANSTGLRTVSGGFYVLD